MTRGNMRANGVRTQAVWCDGLEHHHRAFDVSAYLDDVPVPACGPRNRPPQASPKNSAKIRHCVSPVTLDPFVPALSCGHRNPKSNHNHCASEGYTRHLDPRPSAHRDLPYQSGACVCQRAFCSRAATYRPSDLTGWVRSTALTQPSGSFLPGRFPSPAIFRA